MTSVGTFRPSSIMLFSGTTDPYSHQVRLALAEKGISVDVVEVDPDNPNEDWLQLSPERILPTLVDRDLVLINARIILEYLDERFPHPPLLPVHPVMRARYRLMMQQIDQDWMTPVMALAASAKRSSKQQQALVNHLLQVVPIFERNPFFFGKEFSMIDCCIAPILWRFPCYGVHLPEDKASAILAYAERVFERTTFQASLTEAEYELREELGNG